MAVPEVDILSPRLTDDRVTLTLPATGRQTTVHRDGLGEAPGGQAVWAEAWGHRRSEQGNPESESRLGYQGVEGDVTARACDAHLPVGREVRKPGCPEAVGSIAESHALEPSSWAWSAW